MSNWDELSLRDKAEFIKVGVRNGLTSISDIKEQYNKFQEINASAGNLVKVINENTKQEVYLGDPSHNYDFTQSEEWADAHGYYPDNRGHRDDRVKKPSHPTHPSRGYFKSMNQFDLSDEGFEDPNYILYGLNDGGQDPQAAMTYKGGIVLPELTVTPQGNYIYNSYDNVVNKFGEGGYTTPEEEALKKIRATTKPASNYSEAVDMEVSKIREDITNYIQKHFPSRSLGLTNCTLTASQFYGKPIGRASTIVNDPNKYGFYEVDEKYAIPGTMIIASDPDGVEDPKYHTMVLSEFADKNYPFVYNDILYNVLEGDILTSYSKGKNTPDSWKTKIPLKTYNDQSQGKTRNRFYRPLDENGLPNVLLPEVVVTLNKQGNLKNVKN